jgi:prolyl oligopeptidase PreP (S9A serine peptidase family)
MLSFTEIPKRSAKCDDDAQALSAVVFAAATGGGDLVVPAHSFKFAATLQAMHTGTTPVLIRTETKAGHGAGIPTAKIIEERSDLLAFLTRVLGVTH